MTDDTAAPRGFRSLDHAADMAIEAWGETLSDLFAAAAEGMFSESEDLHAIPPETEWSIELQADTREDLLRSWLSELLWLWEREEAVPCAFEVREVAEQPWRLSARVQGGPTPTDRPHTGAPIKAVTYHELRVWPDDQGRWWAHVVFDV
jgi:SHS2 domain-containing protein